MRRDFRTGRVRPLAVVLLSLLFVSCTNAVAAELSITPLIEGDEDIAKVATRANGEVGILCDSGVDLLRGDGTRLPLARPATGEILYLADGGEYFGAASYRPGAADFTPTATFELRDARGNVIWRTGETEDVTYGISSKGAVVGMSLNINVPERNSLDFFDDTGAIIARVSVPYLEMGRFDPSGAVFLAMSAEGGLQAFDGRGTPLWSVPDCRLFAATEGAHDVAVVGQHELCVVRNGIQAASVPLGDLLVRRVAIAPDGNRIAIAGKHEIRVYDCVSLRLVWSQRTEDEALSWTSIDVASGGGWVMAGVARDLGPSFADDRRHPDGEVRAYDAAGVLAHRASLTFPIWNIWTPTVTIDRSGKAATISTRRAVYRTVLP